MYSDVAIIVPARIGSTRLIRKPLTNIGNLTLIEHIADQLNKTNMPNIYFAVDSKEIAEQLNQSSVKVIMTQSDLATGTDRVYNAFTKIHNNEHINYIVNVQGDMPFIDPLTIIELVNSLKNSNFDIVTPVVKVERYAVEGESNVCAIAGIDNKALYFSRSIIPHGAQDYLYHVGVYGYRRQALEKYINLPMSPLEKIEKLEQLRALENGMTIGVCYVNAVPISVDTQADLDKAINYYNQNKVANIA